MKTFLLAFFTVSLLGHSSANGSTAKPEHYSLPSGYIYIECTLHNCSDNSLREAATEYVYRHGVGRYEFLLGNVITENVFQMTATLRDFCGREPDCSGGLTLLTSEATPHQDIVSEFKGFSNFLKTYPRSIDVPADITPTIPLRGDDDFEARLFEIQKRIIQTYPQFGMGNIFKKSVKIKLKFEDGSEGDYVFFISVYSIKLIWEGTGRDADGNLISESISTTDRSFFHQVDDDGAVVMVVDHNPLGAQAGYAVAGGFSTWKQDCHMADGSYVCRIRRL